MPNAKVLSEKQAIVASLTEKLQGSAAGVIVDYKGITVAEDTALRAECRKNDVEYAVVKNTLLRFAFNNVGLNELDDQLNGTTSLAIAADPDTNPPWLNPTKTRLLLSVYGRFCTYSLTASRSATSVQIVISEYPEKSK